MCPAVSSSELALLRQAFQGLAERSNPADIVDRATFLRVFPFPGFLGERLFECFKRLGGDGVEGVTLDAWLSGLATCCRGTPESQLRFLFDMLDLAGTGSITRAELSTVLSQLPRGVIAALAPGTDPAAASPELDWSAAEAVVDSLVSSAFGRQQQLRTDVPPDSSAGEQRSYWACALPICIRTASVNAALFTLRCFVVF